MAQQELTKQTMFLGDWNAPFADLTSTAKAFGNRECRPFIADGKFDFREMLN